MDNGILRAGLEKPLKQQSLSTSDSVVAETSCFLSDGFNSLAECSIVLLYVAPTYGPSNLERLYGKYTK